MIEEETVEVPQPKSFMELANGGGLLLRNPAAPMPSRWQVARGERKQFGAPESQAES
ncbi:MAG: hypothetical protein RL701_7135 [Pseudomonadota bacterium]|jgi:hypothetical protein